MIATALGDPAPRRLTIDALADLSDAATRRGILVQLLEPESEATRAPEPSTSTASAPLLVAH